MPRQTSQLRLTFNKQYRIPVGNSHRNCALQHPGIRLWFGITNVWEDWTGMEAHLLTYVVLEGIWVFDHQND